MIDINNQLEKRMQEEIEKKKDNSYIDPERAKYDKAAQIASQQYSSKLKPTFLDQVKANVKAGHNKS